MPGHNRFRGKREWRHSRGTFEETYSQARTQNRLPDWRPGKVDRPALDIQICLAGASATMAAHSLTYGDDESMASVKIDLGFGEQAILSERAVSGIVTAKLQRDAEEFLRRWPRTRSIHQERNYLRQLRLHIGYNTPGVNSSEASALLRLAVTNGKITVVIERAATRMSGGFNGPQPTGRGGAIASSHRPFAEMAAGGGGSSVLFRAVDRRGFCPQVLLVAAKL